MPIKPEDSQESALSQLFPSVRNKRPLLRRQGKGKSTGLKKIDIYGQNIQLAYRGDEKFKTTPGAIVSLMVIAVMMAYTGFKTYVLFNKVNPTISKAEFIRDLDSEGAFRPYQLGFDFAFGIVNGLDPSVGFYQVQEVL